MTKKVSKTVRTKIKSDKQWGWFNADLQKYMMSGDYWSLGSTYYEMAEFVKNEGKDNTYLINLGYKTRLDFQVERLKEYKKSGVANGVEVIGAGDNACCEECKRLDGKIFPISDALLSNPLPVKECVHPYGCRCVYGPTFIDEQIEQLKTIV
jgi:hypothetical protein